MDVFIDCEFNSFQGKLITMALVSMEGHSMYCQVPLEEKVDPWVDEHVMPILENPEQVSHEELPYKIAHFLSQFDKVNIIADWPDDIRFFCEYLITGPGYRVDTPPLTMEIIRLDAESTLPHNALHDAWGIRDMYLALMTD
jgi:hypothetical protein